MIKKFDFWNPLVKSKLPDSKSFLNVKKGIDDSLTVAKLCFSFLAGLLQPFMTAFEGDGPMLPYLCISVKELVVSLLVVSLLGLILRPKVIEEAQTSALVKLAQNEKNLVETKNVHLGFAAERELQNLLKCGKVNQEQVLNRKKEALNNISNKQRGGWVFLKNILKWGGHNKMVLFDNKMGGRRL